jgi:hypothetical protein
VPLSSFLAVLAAQSLANAARVRTYIHVTWHTVQSSANVARCGAHGVGLPLGNDPNRFLLSQRDTDRSAASSPPRHSQVCALACSERAICSVHRPIHTKRNAQTEARRGVRRRVHMKCWVSSTRRAHTRMSPAARFRRFEPRGGGRPGVWAADRMACQLCKTSRAHTGRCATSRRF